jgi:alpha-1,3/alpha-1,6-mannosyltransferase
MRAPGPGSGRKMRIAIVHPDLGLGGAERLMVDAALWLQQAGHQVTVLTTHHDPERCFDETRNGTLDVRVLGDVLPTRLYSRVPAIVTLARMGALGLGARRWRGSFDVVFCDLVAHVTPLLRASLGARVVYYCHFPDRLLAPRRGGWYRLYRWLINSLEAAGIRGADLVLVNSRFTAAAFREVFPGREPTIVYPGVDCPSYATAPPLSEHGPITLLSVNRFQRSKGLPLAVSTLAGLRGVLPASIFTNVRLVIAGGYDSRLAEASAVLEELRAAAEQLGVAGQVDFVLNPDDTRRRELLAECRCVLYTPRGEHFGLVPLEAMAAARPVIAVNDGGPLETIVDGENGFLCPATAEAFAAAAAAVIQDAAAARRMGEAGRRHVLSHFSRERFGQSLEEQLRSIAGERA